MNHKDEPGYDPEYCRDTEPDAPRKRLWLVELRGCRGAWPYARVEADSAWEAGNIALDRYGRAISVQVIREITVGDDGREIR